VKKTDGFPNPHLYNSLGVLAGEMGFVEEARAWFKQGTSSVRVSHRLPLPPCFFFMPLLTPSMCCVWNVGNGDWKGGGGQRKGELLTLSDCETDFGAVLRGTMVLPRSTIEGVGGWGGGVI